jgi:hypothetical protein
VLRELPAASRGDAGVSESVNWRIERIESGTDGYGLGAQGDVGVGPRGTRAAGSLVGAYP